MVFRLQKTASFLSQTTAETFLFYLQQHRSIRMRAHTQIFICVFLLESFRQNFPLARPRGHEYLLRIPYGCFLFEKTHRVLAEQRKKQPLIRTLYITCLLAIHMPPCLRDKIMSSISVSQFLPNKCTVELS